MKPSRSLLIAAAVVAVVTAVVLGLTVAAALRHNRNADERPELSVAVDGTLHYVDPFLFCEDVAAAKCDPRRQPARIAVPPGQAIWVTLPKYVSNRPWDVSVQYLYPGGASNIVNTTHLEPGESLITLVSKPEAIIAQIELHVPSSVQDSFGNLISQAVWAIDTLPDDRRPAA